MITVGVHGATGKSGRLVVECLSASSALQLGAALVSPSSAKLGQVCRSADANTDREVIFGCDRDSAVATCDVWIDFSAPAPSLELVRVCAAHKKPVLVATTGFSEAQEEELQLLAKSTAILKCSNTSLGVFVLGQLAELAARLLGSDYQIEIFEMHHRFKKDAPSGTALTLARSLAHQTHGEVVTNRDGVRKGGEIGVSAARGGDIPGEHTIYFIGESDRIELTHRCADRSMFARGAITLAEKLVTKGAGIYSVADLLRG